MKFRISSPVWLVMVAILAAFLRLWQLGTVPPSPDWDEAALGYNAYSILTTGKDEYGTWFPLSLRSYDDYKPPLYMYLAVPSVALFGLSTWSTRLPSVGLGILAVVGTYFLTKELLKKYTHAEELSLVSSFLLAISPWHIQFSRIAFEANVGVTLNIWAVWCFLRGLRTPKLLMASAFFFGLALYAYHSERIFVPLLASVLAYVYRTELISRREDVAKAFVVGVLVLMPLIPVFFNQNTLMRLRGTSSLADQTGLLARSVHKLEEDAQAGSWVGVILDNRRVVWMQTIIDGYLSHFSLKWLFLTGDNPRHHAPDMGLLYLWELPFLFMGLYWVAKQGGPARAVLFAWFVIAPIPASPTTELPHAIRSLVFLPTFQIFTAAGVYNVLLWLRTKRNILNNIFIGAVGVAVFLNIFYFFHMYFTHQNREFSQFWQYGYQQAVEYAQKHKNKYQKVVVSTKLEQPHMFFLFFTRFDPKKYLAQGGTKSGGFAEVHNAFDVYEFRPIDWSREKRDGSVLYIGTPKEIDTSSLETIHYLDGSDAIKIADR